MSLTTAWCLSFMRQSMPLFKACPLGTTTSESKHLGSRCVTPHFARRMDLMAGPLLECKRPASTVCTSRRRCPMMSVPERV